MRSAELLIVMNDQALISSVEELCEKLTTVNATVNGNKCYDIAEVYQVMLLHAVIKAKGSPTKQSM